MSLIFVEGFDNVTMANFALKSWSAGGQSGQTSMMAGRFGGQAIRNAAGGGTTGIAWAKSLKQSASEFWVAVAFRLDAVAPQGNSDWLTLRAGATNTFRLVITTGRQLQLINSAGSGFTIPGALTLGTWYHVEAYGKVNGASGVVGLRLNGVQVLANSTLNIGSTNVDNVALWRTNQPGAGGYTIYDDLVVCDTTGSGPATTWMGDVRVQTIYPSGAGNSQNWTGAYTDIDEAQGNGDTDYISEDTPDDVSTFAFGDLSALATTVYGLQINHMVRKDDAGTREIASVVRQGSTDYAGSTLPAVSASYAYLTEIRDQDPTGSNWTKTNVDGDEFGVKLVT